MKKLYIIYYIIPFIRVKNIPLYALSKHHNLNI